MIKDKIKDILEKPTKVCHPSRYNEEYIKRLIECVELLSDRVEYLEEKTFLMKGNEIKKEIYLDLENYTDDFYQKTNIDAIRSFLNQNKNE